MISRAKRFLTSITRKLYLKSKLTTSHLTQRFGNDYGGFNVCTNGLNSRHIIVYSFGIGEDVSFSDGILRAFDADVYAYDPTPKSIKYVENNSISKNTHFHFSAYGLSNKNEKTLFFLPQNDDWVSGSSVIKKDKKDSGIEVEMKKIETLMEENGHDHIDLLKMDIEGSEFDVVNQWIESAKSGHKIPSIDQICVEVHDRFIENGYATLKTFVNELFKLEYKLINISGSYEELTFLKTKL